MAQRKIKPKKEKYSFLQMDGLVGGWVGLKSVLRAANHFQNAIRSKYLSLKISGNPSSLFV